MINQFEKISTEIKKLYNNVDESFSSYKACCEKGCAHCCYQPIEIVACEEVPISEYIKNSMDGKLKQIVKNNIIKWAIHFNRYYTDAEAVKSKQDLFIANKSYREKVDEDHVPCPFLIENSCSIYDVRPLVCRSHIELDSSIHCKKDGLRESPKEIQMIRNKYFEKLKVYPNASLRYLPVSVSETFGIVNIFKPHPVLRLT